jgi:hypothetical protein
MANAVKPAEVLYLFNAERGAEVSFDRNRASAVR